LYYECHLRGGRNVIIHVVKKGDSLWQIANRYGVNYSDISNVNELPNPNQLIVGQSLVIPIPAKQHTVKSGESLWQIAQNYGVSPQAIIQANQQLSDPSSISPGMNIVIPARTHVVQQGENLSQIAQQYNGVSVNAIIQENQIQDPSAISPGMNLVIPYPKPTIDVNAFVTKMGEEGAQITREKGPYLTYITPFVYTMQPDGSLDTIEDTPIIQAAQNQQVVPMMSITNFTPVDPGSDLAQTILSSTDLQNTLLDNVMNVMKNKGYQGINIDFENVYPEDRENYNQFLQRSVDRLKPEGYFVSTSVAPKTSADQKGILYEAHDYEAHGRIADFVVLMTYEWGYRLGPPQAISPVNQMKRVVDYALTVMPPEKIFLGFQLYGRDWLLPHQEGQEAETFDMQEAIRRAAKYNADIKYDEQTQSPYFRYYDEQGRQHEVWFEDARSTQAKFDLVTDNNLRGLSYWELGFPFPQNWAMLQDRFNIRKI